LPVSDSFVGEFEALLAKAIVPAAVPLDWGVNITVTGMLFPAVIVNGNETPLNLNSDVVVEADDTVTFDPVALKLAVKLPLCPTTTLPKSKAVGLMLSWPGTVPVPDKEMLRVELEASEVNEIVPLAEPPAVGANVAPKVKLCPAMRVRGGVNPLMLNPLPLTFACETVIVVPPVFVRVSDCVVLPLTRTLPKLSVCELADNTPGVAPVPDSVILRVEFDALLTSDTLPLTAPLDCGVNVTLKLVL
jgi:hypothetical protein